MAGFIGESNLLRGTIAAAADGTLRAVTMGGTEFVVARGAGTAEGATVLLIRPESLRLGIDQPGGRHAVRGTVEEIVYLGGIRKYTIRINAHETLVVRPPNQAGARELGIASRVRVEWEPQDLRVL